MGASPAICIGGIGIGKLRLAIGLGYSAEAHDRGKYGHIDHRTVDVPVERATSELLSMIIRSRDETPRYPDSAAARSLLPKLEKFRHHPSCNLAGCPLSLSKSC